MNRLRNRLILIFVAATLAPLAATVWITNSLLEYSLEYSSTAQLDELADSLRVATREYYQHMRDGLRKSAERGELKPEQYASKDQAHWPERVKAFAATGKTEWFEPAGTEGDRLQYLVRRGDDVWVYSVALGEVALDRVTRQIRAANALVERIGALDLRRGFKLVYVLLAASLWLVALGLLVFLAHRISRPIQQLTAGLTRLASGDLNARVSGARDDEIGRAIRAFNEMAERLQESTERLVYLRQLSSWQTLARKTAHEVKNSLTPIRLTVEEMVARFEGSDRAFISQAAEIVVDEIETLERRIRAFSQFAAEPPVSPCPLDVNSLLQERVAFLKMAHPEVAYDCRLSESVPSAMADQDLLKGILTNLLENAAEAAGSGGHILGRTFAQNGHVAIEVHDSGPGLSEQARSSLFQPTISFKKQGMGLGLSIARKSALLSGGDIVLVKGELGGAGFRVLLPVAAHAFQAHTDRG
ncbi:MAG: HAMP domain-containing protein [Acidobacteriia bacterium]|nr:HAMP domain-containing protein [Terriglobia bacterium]